jgi:hypothetical protein
VTSAHQTHRRYREQCGPLENAALEETGRGPFSGAESLHRDRGAAYHTP